MAQHVFRIVRDGQGMGGFLSPPGDPTLVYSVMEKSSNRWNAYTVGMYSLDTALTEPWIPDGIRRSAQRIMDSAERVESPAWVANIYGYFRNMWTRNGAMWTDTRDLVSGRPEGTPDDWHAGAVYIRQYFPDHVTRVDLIADPGKGYGSWPCAKCGQRVQYEARWDALTVYPTGTVCPADGGAHTYEEQTAA